MTLIILKLKGSFDIPNSNCIKHKHLCANEVKISCKISKRLAIFQSVQQNSRISKSSRQITKLLMLHYFILVAQIWPKNTPGRFKQVGLWLGKPNHTQQKVVLSAAPQTLNDSF